MNNNLPIICDKTLDKGYGYVKDLSLTEREIESLLLQGYIKTTITINGETWSLTKRGKKVRLFFLNKRSLKNKVLDWIFRYILLLKTNI